MIEGYLSPALATKWHDEYKPRLFATAKQLGTLEALTFWRDTDTDTIAVGPYEVLIVMANHAIREANTPTSLFAGADGEFRHEAPFEVHRGDRFTLPDGASGHVTSSPVSAGAFLRAPFVLER